MTQRAPSSPNNIPALNKPFNPNDHIMKLTGKDYLPVAARIAWLNAEFGHDVSIITEPVKWREWSEEDPKRSKPNQPVMRTVTEVMFQARITFPNGHIVTAHGSESSKDFGDFIEKAESKALGRALGYAGYGTLQAPEFDETATIARAEQAANGRSGENTYDNTRAVDSAQDLSRVRARKESEPESTTSTSSTASSPSISTPAPQPVAAPVAPASVTPPSPSTAVGTLTHDQLVSKLQTLVTRSRGSEDANLAKQVAASLSAANQAAGVARAGLLPSDRLAALVADVEALVEAAKPLSSSAA